MYSSLALNDLFVVAIMVTPQGLVGVREAA
jgi:hypothetical protein